MGSIAFSATVLFIHVAAKSGLENGFGTKKIRKYGTAVPAAWFIAAMVIWASREARYPLIAAAALPFALLILGGGALSDTSPGPLVASLNSFWLYIHIFFAWLAFQ